MAGAAAGEGGGGAGGGRAAVPVGVPGIWWQLPPAGRVSIPQARSPLSTNQRSRHLAATTTGSTPSYLQLPPAGGAGRAGGARGLGHSRGGDGGVGPTGGP
eukprot:1194498-Prorocentrum_minimum.AAC.5